MTRLQTRKFRQKLEFSKSLASGTIASTSSSNSVPKPSPLLERKIQRLQTENDQLEEKAKDLKAEIDVLAKK